MAADGLLLVDKRPGSTSHDAVQQARRILRERRIGHCGTLDPDATGLLLLPVGATTRLTRFLIHAPKVYEGVVQLGAATDTYDASGKVVSEAPVPESAVERLTDVLAGFVGTFEQRLPAYSARKVGGVKLYELARRGEEVPESSKEVTVYELEATGPLAEGRFPFRLACSSGTYARSIAHDVGQELGCGGHLASLRRTAIGPFRIEDALPLEAIAERSARGETLGSAWIPLSRVPLPFSELVLDATQERRVEHGQTVLAKGADGEEGDWVKLVDGRGELVAVASIAERVGEGRLTVLQPRVVFRS
ncbi:MAG: tRNA pseudouridine(55) synthase TruB [Acidobacteria bacterium]|nr:tRNA pseudouridine(55) synthase TruB [Acidobacteriota bacterium]MCB9378029.1 tRNA pseudouridine(55) synthase TruB [Holophagales bacterium]